MCFLQDFADTVFLPTNAAFKKAKISVDGTAKVRPRSGIKLLTALNL